MTNIFRTSHALQIISQLNIKRMLKKYLPVFVILQEVAVQ